MAVSFSNHHLRIPEGFSELLMGLSKEVLRDQPEDIPSYAARYFKELLRQRNESNLDPDQFTDKLRDKFYNTQSEGPEMEPSAEITTSEEKIHRSRTDSESNRAAETTEFSTTQPYSSQEDDSSESEAEEQREDQEKNSVSEEGEEEEDEEEDEVTGGLAAAELRPLEPSESEHTVTAVHVVDTDVRDIHGPGSAPPQTTSDGILSLSEELNVCAQELGMTGGAEGNKEEIEVVTVEALGPEGEADVEVEEPTPVSLRSEPAEVDICAAELGLTERKIEKLSSEVDSRTEESLKPQHEEMVIRETPEGHQPEVEHQADMTEEEVKTQSEAPAGEISEGSSHVEATVDDNPVPEEESLVEVSFEDVPDPRQLTGVGEDQPVDEGSGDELLTEEFEMQDKESEFQEVTAEEVETGSGSGSGKDPEDEPDVETVQKEVKSEEEEMDNQVEMKDEDDDNDDNDDDDNDDDDNDDDDEKKESDSKSIAEENVKVADERTRHTDIDGEDENTKPYEFDLSYETTDTAGEDKEDSQGDLDLKDGEGDDGVDRDVHSSAAAQPNTAVAAVEGGSGTTEASAEHLSEEHQGTLLESGSGKEVTEEEESGIHTEAGETGEGMCEEENVNLVPAADDDAPSDKPGEEEKEEEEPEFGVDSTQQETEESSGKQEECSRPQEEEEDIMDIPLDDPEANRAAAKIQAGFRGHMTRKKMKPEDKAEGEEVSSTGEVLNGSQGATATGGTGAVESDDTSVPEQ